MSNARVSVGIITYNHEKFIVDCINSIRQQNYKNLDVYIADDHSTDNTVSIVENYMNENPGAIKQFIKQPKNVGISENTNSLLDIMDGDYIECFGGDDLMLPNKISGQINLLEKNPHASFCFSNMFWFSSETNKKICDHFGLLQKPTLTLYENICDFSIPTPTLLIRKSVLGTTRCRKDIKYISDCYFVFELLKKGSAVYYPEKTVAYRKHSKSVTINNSFYEDRLTIQKLLHQTLSGEYKKPLQKYNNLVRYAEILEKTKKKEFIDVIYNTIKMLPAFVSSPKWFLRLMFVGKNFLTNIIKKQK